MKETITPDRPDLRKATDQGCDSWQPVFPPSVAPSAAALRERPPASADGSGAALTVELSETAAPKH